MKNITFEELATKYPLENVAPWGACLVVPGAEFDPDWEVSLEDHGFRCYFTDLNGKAVTLVQKRKAAPEKAADPPEDPAPQKLKGCQKGPSWTSQDEQRLIKRVGELTGPIKLRCAKLAPEFNRSAIGLTQKFKKLERPKRVYKSKRAEKSAGPETPNSTASPPIVGVGPAASPPPEESYKATNKGLVIVIDILAKKVESLNEFYETQGKAYIELKTYYDDIVHFVEATVEDFKDLKTKTDQLQKALAQHKHAAGSGEAMTPMEATT